MSEIHETGGVAQGLVTIQVNILSMYKHIQGRTSFLPPLASSRVCFYKNDRCAFTRGSRGEVMIFFEKNKVLGVEPNRVLNILEGIKHVVMKIDMIMMSLSCL
jgi:hypothetical protein